MGPLIPLYVWFAINAVGLGLAVYADYRARHRFRAGELPAAIRLLGWFQSGINPFILFSPAFRHAQDASTRWLVWPLRLIVGANLVLALILVAGVTYLIWRNPL